MLYQDKYQAHGDPAKLNISSVIYTLGNSAPDGSPTQYKITEFPAHLHSFYEISYHSYGSALIEVDNRIVPLEPDSLTFYPPLSIHRIQNDNRPSSLVLQFSQHLIQNIFSSQDGTITLLPTGKLLRDGRISLKKDSRAYAAIQQFLKLSPSQQLFTDPELCVTEYPPLTEIQLHAALFSLLSALIEDDYLQVTVSEQTTKDIVRIESLLSFLNANPEKKVSMEDAAAKVNMSYSYFSRTFKQTTGMSYVDLCNILRVNRAQELLRTTTMSVTEISIYLNFGSISYFNRIFKQFTGSTPLVYRSAVSQSHAEQNKTKTQQFLL